MKTPQEAAKELVNKFYQPITINLNHVGRYNNSDQMWNHAKACALICLEEMKTAIYKLESYAARDYKNDAIKELQQVKTSIETL